MDPEAEVREREWKKLVLQVDKLTLVQRLKLHSALERHGAEAQVVALIDRAGEVAPRCPVPCDHFPLRSWPLFRARDLMRGVIESFSPEPAR